MTVNSRTTKKSADFTAFLKEQTVDLGDTIKAEVNMHFDWFSRQSEHNTKILWVTYTSSTSALWLNSLRFVLETVPIWNGRLQPLKVILI